MKYEAPKYEKQVIEADEIMSASNEKYEIKEEENGEGSVIMNAFDLFK